MAMKCRKYVIWHHLVMRKGEESWLLNMLNTNCGAGGYRTSGDKSTYMVEPIAKGNYQLDSVFQTHVIYHQNCLVALQIQAQPYLCLLICVTMARSVHAGLHKPQHNYTTLKYQVKDEIKPIDLFLDRPNHKDMKKYKLSPMQWNILRDFKLILELTWVKKSWSTDEYKKAKQIVLQMMTQYCEQMGHNKLEVEPLPALAARLKTLTWHFGYTINSNNESSEDEPSPTVLC
ncbi:hypothetical protein EDD16DRAFT_1523484 [Pisolithus croceorrhizus]|nr:hypothetical protein EDD16DRAFT_1523484 [Pisolithus croceorrhizus]